jgi:hypothetical protein
MTTTNTKRVVIGIAAATFLLLVSNGAPAQAYAQDSWTNAQVSCSHGTYQYVDSSLQHLVFGDVWVHQTSATNPVTGEYHLQSAQGNNTSAKVAASGQTVIWSGVIASTYKVWHTAQTSVNCNGSLPGDGNTLTSGWARFDF